MTRTEIDNIFKSSSSAHEDFLEKETPIIIYGAGNFGKNLFNFLNEKKFSVCAFIDQNAHKGDQWNNVPLLPPDSKEVKNLSKKNIPVFIGVHNRDSNLVAIEKSLDDLLFTHIYNPVNYFRLVFSKGLNYFWLTDPEYYASQKQNIINAFSLLSDNKSKQLFLSLLKQRILGDYSALPSPSTTDQYFPVDIPAWKSPIRFIDCGAYDGDTLEFINQSGQTIDYSVAFEPDLNNFKKIADTIKERKIDFPVMAYLAGVFSKTGQASFSQDGAEGGKLEVDGSRQIQTYALDDVLFNFGANLIKMDIEGAELEALQGAQEIIKHDRPGLAICVYHQPAHLWQIIELINSWDLGYSFYLRTHAYNGFETVLYAIPG